MTNPVGTKEQREELRSQHRIVNIYIPVEAKANLRLALDGLDIAEEMAEVLSDIQLYGLGSKQEAMLQEVLHRQRAWKTNPPPGP